MPEQTDFMRTDPVAEITQLFADWGFSLDHENKATRAFKGKVKKTLHARKADKSGHPYANLRNAIEECLFKYGADKIETEIKQPGLISDYVTISVFYRIGVEQTKVFKTCKVCGGDNQESGDKCSECLRKAVMDDIARRNAKPDPAERRRQKIANERLDRVAEIEKQTGKTATEIFEENEKRGRGQAGMMDTISELIKEAYANE